MSDEAPEPAGLVAPLNTDSPHARAALEAGLPARFHVIDLSGLSGARVAETLAMLTRVSATDGLIPVFVTDLLEYDVFRRAGVIFEAVPPIAGSALIAPDLDWRKRRQEVLALIDEKWQPAARTDLSDVGSM